MTQTSNNVYEKFSKVIDAYIYSELYKREVIRSKTFNFSTSLRDVRSKLMYILKSISIATVKEKQLEDVFLKVSFIRDKLILEYDLDSNTLLGKLSYFYILNYFEQIDCRFSSIHYYTLDFKLDEIDSMFDTNRTKLLNVKSTMDEAINNILFIKSAICDIGMHLKDLRTLSEEELCKLKNCRFMVLDFHANLRYNLKEKLEALDVLANRDEIFETEVKFNLKAPQSWKSTFQATVEYLHSKHVRGVEVEEIKTPDAVSDDGKYIYIAGQRVALNT